MAKITINNDKNVAFAGFVYCVAGLSRHPWTKRGPLMDVPDEVIAEAGKFGSLYKLSFTNDPLVESREIGLPQVHQDFIVNLRTLFEELWQKYHDSIIYTTDSLSELLTTYEHLLVDTIEAQTGCKWRFDEVYLVPSLYAGGTVTKQSAFIGFKANADRSFDKTWPVVIHELVHVNTNPIKAELKDKLRLGSDTYEVTTVLLTNRVIAKLNERFNGSILANQYATYYDYIKQWHDDFDQVTANERSYKDTLLKVDRFFAKHDYQGYFSQFKVKAA